MASKDNEKSCLQDDGIDQPVEMTERVPLNEDQTKTEEQGLCHTSAAEEGREEINLGLVYKISICCANEREINRIH